MIRYERERERERKRKRKREIHTFGVIMYQIFADRMRTNVYI